MTSGKGAWTQSVLQRPGIGQGGREGVGPRAERVRGNEEGRRLADSERAESKEVTSPKAPGSSLCVRRTKGEARHSGVLPRPRSGNRGNQVK